MDFLKSVVSDIESLNISVPSLPFFGSDEPSILKSARSQVLYSNNNNSSNISNRPSSSTQQQQPQQPQQQQSYSAPSYHNNNNVPSSYTPSRNYQNNNNNNYDSPNYHQPRYRPAHYGAIADSESFVYQPMPYNEYHPEEGGGESPISRIMSTTTTTTTTKKFNQNSTGYDGDDEPLKKKSQNQPYRSAQPFAAEGSFSPASQFSKQQQQQQYPSKPAAAAASYNKSSGASVASSTSSARLSSGKKAATGPKYEEPNPIHLEWESAYANLETNRVQMWGRPSCSRATFPLDIDIKNNRHINKGKYNGNLQRLIKARPTKKPFVEPDSSEDDDDFKGGFPQSYQIVRRIR